MEHISTLGVCGYFFLSNASKSIGHLFIIIAGGLDDGTKVIQITKDGVQELPEMFSTQQEGDTRMIFHLGLINEVLSFEGIQGSVLLKSNDTDELDLAVHFYKQLTSVVKLWVERGRPFNISFLFIPFEIHSPHTYCVCSLHFMH